MNIAVEGEVTDLGNVDLKGVFEEAYIVLRTDKAIIFRPIKNWRLIVNETDKI